MPVVDPTLFPIEALWHECDEAQILHIREKVQGGEGSMPLPTAPTNSEEPVGKREEMPETS